MIQVFLNAVKAQNEQETKRLLEDAHADFVRIYADKNLSPAEIQELAIKYVQLHHCQELQFSLTKNINK